MLRSILVSLSFLFISGCATQTSRFAPELIQDVQMKEDEGIVVISTGAKEHCISEATFLKVYNSESTEVGLLSVDAYVLKTDYTTHHGNIHALKLPQGDYFLWPWLANPYASYNSPQRINFSVDKAKVKYLGEYFMEISCGYMQAIIRDNLERDYALLKQKNKLFEGLSIEKSLLNL